MASLKQGLSNIALFKSLSDDALEKIASSMTVSEVAAEQTVVAKGQVANEMFFLLSGMSQIELSLLACETFHASYSERGLNSCPNPA